MFRRHTYRAQAHEEKNEWRMKIRQQQHTMRLAQGHSVFSHHSLMACTAPSVTHMAVREAKRGCV